MITFSNTWSSVSKAFKRTWQWWKLLSELNTIPFSNWSRTFHRWTKR